MSVPDLIIHVSRVFWSGLTIVTLVNYLRYRTAIQRDIFLMFLSLSIGPIAVILRGITGLALPWLTPLGLLAIVMQPFIMVRLVRYFHDVPRWFTSTMFGGMVVSWILLITQGSPLPPVPTLIIIVYFVVGNGYAVFAFTRGMFTSIGVVRQRLRFAAAGSAFLVAVFLIAAVSIILPSALPATTPFLQFLGLCSALVYYLAFAPPTWLRLSWKHMELRNYLQALPQSDASTRTLETIFEPLHRGVKRVMGAQVRAVRVLLTEAVAGEDTGRIVFQSQSDEVEGDTDVYFRKVFREILSEPEYLQKSAVFDCRDALPPDIQQLLTAFHGEAMVTVPILTRDQSLGLLIVVLESTSLFVEDDLRLLSLFTQQTALQLENHLLVEKLYRQNEALEKMVAERTLALQRSNDELKSFAYIASHDLQEPLRTITSYLQLIEMVYTDKLDDEGRQFIQFAVDGAKRMKELISDVLIYSRLETGAEKFTQVDFQNVVNEVLKSLDATITETAASISADPLPKLRADRRLILQLFQNLISNAIKYRGERPPEIHITVTQQVTKQKKEWLFAVRDNGIGIEPQYLEQIFVVFRRLHGQGKYEGTGIGLAVCKKAVELHNGRIWAESEPGKGSTFYFTIPA
jgi:signal transduction histidine kinase